jgi:hypothetical protein
MPNANRGIYINFGNGFCSTAFALRLHYVSRASHYRDVQALDDALVGRRTEPQKSN